MEKTLSVTGTLLALVFAVSLAACQPQPNASAPTETPVVTQSPEPATGPTPVIAPETPAPQKTGSTKKTTVQKKTATPRLDSLEKRVKRLEDLARSCGAPI